LMMIINLQSIILLKQQTTDGWDLSP
jgi:hypothetical protein